MNLIRTAYPETTALFFWIGVHCFSEKDALLKWYIHKDSTKNQVKKLFDKISEKEKSLKQGKEKTSVKGKLQEKKKETVTQRKKPVMKEGVIIESME